MTTMNGIWRGVMCASVLAAVPPRPGAAAPLWNDPLALVQPAAPAAPVSPTPPTRTAAAPRDQQQREREARREAQREAQRERDVRRDAERVHWSDGDTIVRAFTGGDGITLDLVNTLGDVVVVGGKGREGRLSVVRRVQGRGPDVQALLESLSVDVTSHANRVAVRTALPPRGTTPSNGRVRVRTDYEIALPAGTALDLRNVQGNVVLSNVAGDVHVVAMAGDVLGEALSRVRLLRSMSGDVALSRSTVAGEANLQSVSGNVTASGVKATSLTLGSVTGNVRVTGSSSDRASVSTISGNVEFDAIPRAAGRYEIKTHGGNIIVVAPGRGGFEFEAATVKGDVRSDIPTEPAAPGRHYVRGSVGDASAFFDLSSFAGNIRVVRAGNEQK